MTSKMENLLERLRENDADFRIGKIDIRKHAKLLKRLEK